MVLFQGGLRSLAGAVEGDDDAEPLVDHLSVDAGVLDRHESWLGAGDQLPHAFRPEVGHESPVPLVAHPVVRIDEAEKEHDGQALEALEVLEP
jgi:hypothetical protein